MRSSLQVVLLIAVGACYRPELGTCAVRCGPACPPSFTCGADGFCHEPGDPIDCRFAPDADTGGGADAPGDDLCDPCELVSQCGCPGEACDITASGNICRPIGNGTQGTPCAAQADCAAGYSCLGPVGSRACYRFCANDSVCAGTGGICDLTAGSSSQLMCTTNCNPLTSAGCPSGWGCHVGLNNETNRSHSNCHFAGASGQGASCARMEDCQAGFGCIQLSPARCLRYCIVGGAQVCTGGATCRSFSGGGVHIAGTEYGVCL